MNNNVEFIEESFEYESDVRVNERNCGNDYGDDDDNKSEDECKGDKGEEMSYGINACESMRKDKDDIDSVKEFGEGVWDKADEEKEEEEVEKGDEEKEEEDEGKEEKEDEEEEKKSSYEEKKSCCVNDSCSEMPSLENIDLGMSRNDGMSVKEEEKKNEKRNVIYNGFLRSEESAFHIEVNPNVNNNNNNGDVIQNKNDLVESNISIDKFKEDNDKVENIDKNENDKIYNENVNKSIDIQDIESSFNDNNKQNEESCKDNNDKENIKDIVNENCNDNSHNTEDKATIVTELNNNDKIENSRYNDNVLIENNKYSQNITNNKSKNDNITKVNKSIKSNKISISTTNKSKLKETQTSHKNITITNTSKTSTINISTNTNNNKSNKTTANTNINSTTVKQPKHPPPSTTIKQPKHPLPIISTTNIKPTLKKPNNFRSLNFSHSSSPFLPLSKSTSIPTPTKPITSSTSHTYLSPHSFQTPLSLHKDITPLITSIFPTNTSLQSFKSSLDILPLSSNQHPSNNTIGPLQYEPSTQFNLRKVKADGNCFYRSFLFSLLEQIIFTNNISFLLSILHDLKSRIDALPSSPSTAIFPSLISKYKIDIDTTYKCLLTLLIALKSSSSNTTHKAYTILIKMYNNIPHFDLGLICYMHTLIYDYIHLNERNYYSKQFDVPFGNLLPKECECETDTSRSAKWNYEKFYNEYLYKLYVDAEKIIIYVCPFIFNVNVNINVNGDNMVLSSTDDDSNSNTVLNVFLLYRKSHYDVLYEDEFFLKNKDRLCLHFFSDENNKSQQSSLNKIKTCIVCNKSKNIYSLNKTIIICERCMIKELSCSITEHYRTFITNNRKYFLKQFPTSQHILNTIQSTTLVVNCNSSATAVTIKECVDSLTQRNNSLTFDRFIYDSKCKQCLVCDACCKDGERKLRLKLPCECRVDKVECVEMYYDYIKATLPLKQRIECYCGFVYNSYRYIVELINVMEECGVKCDDMVEYYASVVKMNCVICNKEYNRKEDVMYCVMKVSGVKVNTMMKHAVCNACIKKSKEKKVDLVGVGIRCKMCLKEHYILKNNKLEM